jgi:hypothetical protein
MVSRIWYGWTSRENAGIHERLLKEKVFVGIQLLRREVDEEVEFVTIMLSATLDAVRGFAGEDYEACVVPEKARTVLARSDHRSQHYELLVERPS